MIATYGGRSYEASPPSPPSSSSSSSPPSSSNHHPHHHHHHHHHHQTTIFLRWWQASPSNSLADFAPTSLMWIDTIQVFVDRQYPKLTKWSKLFKIGIFLNRSTHDHCSRYAHQAQSWRRTSAAPTSTPTTSPTTLAQVIMIIIAITIIIVTPAVLNTSGKFE